MANYLGVVSKRVLRETPDAWLLEFGEGDERWLPKSIARAVNYRRGLFECEAWFARRAMICQQGQRSRKAIPTAQLVELLTINPINLVDQSDSRAHQREAFNKVVKLRASALFMACRSGKTKVAIDVACTHLLDGRIDHVIWLCPVSVIPTAQWQWGRFAPTVNAVTFFGLETLSGCRLARYTPLLELVRAKRCMLVVDESHMIKNTVAKRSKRTNNLSKLADIKMDLTGTPITRNIEDLYQPFHSLDPRILGYHNRFAFAKAHLVYSDKYPGLVKRTQNVEYITARIEPFVYEYFPPEDCSDTWQTITSPLSERQHYWYGEVKSAILARIAQCDHATSDIYVLFTALQSIVSGFISSRVLNRALGTKGKYPDGITFQSSKLESLLDLRASIDGPVVVWCSRLHEVDTLRQSLPESYVVTGAYTPDERHKTVQSFRASLCGTLIATTQVARRGIDLYESSTAVFYGHSFDWEAREQAAARIKAPGIKDESCAYFDLVIRQSLDERVMESYSRKEHIVGQFVQMLRQDKEAALKALEAL